MYWYIFFLADNTTFDIAYHIVIIHFLQGNLYYKNHWQMRSMDDAEFCLWKAVLIRATKIHIINRIQLSLLPACSSYDFIINIFILSPVLICMWHTAALTLSSGRSRGVATGANAPPFKKSKKISFQPFLKVFGPLQCFCVCHPTKNDLAQGEHELLQTPLQSGV